MPAMMEIWSRHTRIAGALLMMAAPAFSLAAWGQAQPAEVPDSAAAAHVQQPAAPLPPDSSSPEAASPKTDGKEASIRAFRPGERLAYGVSYLGLSVGDLTLLIAGQTNVEGTSVWPIIGTAQTKPAFILYPVRDKFISWFDPRSRLAVGNELLANENKVVRRERMRFDRKQGQATVRREGGGKKRREKNYDLPDGAQDVLAMLYLLRLQPLAPGDVFESPIFTGSKTFTMRASVVGKESIQTRAGQFMTKRVHLEVSFSGELASKREVRMFLTDDERHIPVRVDAEFFLGTLTADLTSAESGF